MTPPNRIQLQFEAAMDDRAAELRAAWDEILADKRVGLQTAAVELDETLDGGLPLVHARLLSESTSRPLCRAPDAPWGARGFGFTSLTCHECQSLMLHPEDAPA